MSALPNASKEVPEHLFGPSPPKGGGAQLMAKHGQARITTFFTRTPVPGKPPGTRKQQEDPPEAAEAAALRTDVTRDAGSAPEPELQQSVKRRPKLHMLKSLERRQRKSRLRQWWQGSWRRRRRRWWW
eukprot:358867-Chlamydomonas_euryale.AAC.3